MPLDTHQYNRRLSIQLSVQIVHVDIKLELNSHNNFQEDKLLHHDVFYYQHFHRLNSIHHEQEVDNKNHVDNNNLHHHILIQQHEYVVSQARWCKWVHPVEVKDTMDNNIRQRTKPQEKLYEQR